VVIAAQTTQNPSKLQKPKIKNGFTPKFIKTVSQTIKIGIFGFQIHLMMD
jgi:hypothetical protein